jgi:hypothetical protein
MADLWMGDFNTQTEGLQHLSGMGIKNRVGEDMYNAYFKFSFVRNPWDKVISQYIYMMQCRPDLIRMLHLHKEKNISLETYIKRTYVAGRQAQWATQSSFLFEGDEPVVDYIGTYETLKKDFDQISSFLDLPDVPLKWENASSKESDYKMYYNHKTARMVYNFYEEDIERFGYKF